MRHLLITLTVVAACLAAVPAAIATPTHFGHSGLLSLPTAETLNEGNICVGLWTNCTSGDGRDGVIVPATITLGLGTFMEAYGSYPNLLFNDDEEVSGRGYADLGFKFRVYGRRSDPFRLGLDLQARRSISDDPQRDGLTDYLSTFIASYKGERFGVHANAGYAVNDSPDDVDYDDQVLLGAGLEFFPADRLRTIAEFSYETEKESGLDGPSEATLGFQYFLTPHLTLNLGAGVGLTDASPDLRILFGLSTCQGVGTFNRPVPRLVDSAEAPEPLPAEPVRKIKIKTITPLVPEATGAPSPLGQLELPLPAGKEKVLIMPDERLPPIDLAGQDPAVSPLVLPKPHSGGPMVIEPFKATTIRKFVLPEQAFLQNQESLSPEGLKYLSLIAEELRRDDSSYLLRVEGYMDSLGSAAYNQQLSYRRAVNAASTLVIKNGLDPHAIFVKGFGEEKPVAANDTDEGRARNRRLELLVLVQQADDLGVEPAPQATSQN